MQDGYDRLVHNKGNMNDEDNEEEGNEERNQVAKDSNVGKDNIEFGGIQGEEGLNDVVVENGNMIDPLRPRCEDDKDVGRTIFTSPTGVNVVGRNSIVTPSTAGRYSNSIKRIDKRKDPYPVLPGRKRPPPGSETIQRQRKYHKQTTSTLVEQGRMEYSRPTGRQMMKGGDGHDQIGTEVVRKRGNRTPISNRKNPPNATLDPMAITIRQSPRNASSHIDSGIQEALDYDNEFGNVQEPPPDYMQGDMDGQVMIRQQIFEQHYATGPQIEQNSLGNPNAIGSRGRNQTDRHLSRGEQLRNLFREWSEAGKFDLRVVIPDNEKSMLSGLQGFPLSGFNCADIHNYLSTESTVDTTLMGITERRQIEGFHTTVRKFILVSFCLDPNLLTNNPERLALPGQLVNFMCDESRIEFYTNFLRRNNASATVVAYTQHSIKFLNRMMERYTNSVVTAILKKELDEGYTAREQNEVTSLIARCCAKFRSRQRTAKKKNKNHTHYHSEVTRKVDNGKMPDSFLFEESNKNANSLYQRCLTTLIKRCQQPSFEIRELFDKDHQPKLMLRNVMWAGK